MLFGNRGPAGAVFSFCGRVPFSCPLTTAASLRPKSGDSIFSMENLSVVGPVWCCCSDRWSCGEEDRLLVGTEALGRSRSSAMVTKSSANFTAVICSDPLQPAAASEELRPSGQTEEKIERRGWERVVSWICWAAVVGREFLSSAFLRFCPPCRRTAAWRPFRLADARKLRLPATLPTC